jgi:hypothetical protein
VLVVMVTSPVQTTWEPTTFGKLVFPHPATTINIITASIWRIGRLHHD